MTDLRKVAVVTGASSGIGAVYADRLAKRGHDLILVARRIDRLNALAGKLSAAYGRRVEVVQADLGNTADLDRVAALLAANADIDLLVNNAGLARMVPVAKSSVGDSLDQINLNITAVVRLTQAVLPGFVARNHGTIINISSILGVQTLPVSAVYSGTKSFVLSFSRALQAELAETGVTVQAVLPAVTATEIWDGAGMAVSSLDASTVMTAENMVDAALAGLDSGEAVTLPPVADAALWDNFSAAGQALFLAARTGKPALRYAVG